MKLARLPHDPSALIDFFEEGLGALGAVSERPWHDRLRVIAEAQAARLWNDDGALVERELAFPPADSQGVRDAARRFFPAAP